MGTLYPGVIPPGDGLVSIWHGTDHPTCADHLKSKPIIATLDAAYQIGFTSDSHGGYGDTLPFQVQLRFKMAEEVHAVLETCGVIVEAMRDNIIAREGFTQLADFGVLENDTDVSEMVKRMASRTVADG